MTMVERVALAIASAASVDAGFAPVSALEDTEAPDHWRAQSRAAIAAMREPTEEMIYHKDNETLRWSIIGIYTAMVDGALSSSVPAKEET